MNPTFAAVIVRELATLVPTGTTPDGPLGYGRDLSCVSDITEDCREVDPQSPEGIAEGVCRRYDTPRGGLPEDPDYGLPMAALCNHGMTLLELRALADQARTEACKDDRVDHAEVTLDYDDVTKVLRASIDLTPVDPALGVFSLVLVVPPDAAPLLESIT